MKYLFLIACSFIFFSCSKPAMKPQTQYVLGTVCTVNLFEDGSEDLYRKIFTELNSIDDKFNVNKTYSEISKVNQKAGTSEAVSVSQDVFEVVELSKKIAGITDNSFNPALGKLITLWGIGTDHQRIPSDEEIEDALKHCSPDSIELIQKEDSFYIEITDSETQIDLGAIVKGYAADELVEILKTCNVEKAVLDLGGNIYVYGSKSKKNTNELWKVGIKNPVDPDMPPVKVINLKSGSVVTSGNYERFFEKDGVRYHHILDGKTGRPAETGIASVSVINERSVICDALATAYFVSGVNGDFDLTSLSSSEIQIVFIDLSAQPMVK